MSADVLKAAIARLALGGDLGREAMAEVVGAIMDGQATPAQMSQR